MEDSRRPLVFRLLRKHRLFWGRQSLIDPIIFFAVSPTAWHDWGLPAGPRGGVGAGGKRQVAKAGPQSPPRELSRSQRGSKAAIVGAVADCRFHLLLNP